MALPTFTAAPRQLRRSELAKQFQYLKAENEVLRKHLGKRPYLEESEKRLLVKLGLAVGKGIKDLLSVVSYPTFRRWVGLYDPANAGKKEGFLAQAPPRCCCGTATASTPAPSTIR